MPLSNPVSRTSPDPTSGSETREKLLNVAETLFAAHGFEGVSLRTLTEQADANLAAVNYHFGSKEALYEQVFVRRIAPMNARRLERLTAASEAAAGKTIPLRLLLDIILRPVVELAASTRPDPHPFPRVLLRSFIEPQPFLRPVLAREFGPLFVRLFPAMRAALPRMEVSTLAFRMRLVMSAALINYATVPLLPINPVFDAALPLFARPPEEQLAHLLAFIEAGLRAPLPDESPII
jgi:AcrR family transcriptional regulator